MKTNTLLSTALGALLFMGVTLPVSAADSREDFNIYADSGAKQTSKDFEPAPEQIDTNFGTLNFVGGAFPDKASTQALFDELDLQRATQAYMDFMPALSLYAIVKAQVRDFGMTNVSIAGVEADFMFPSENYLTGNDITVYAFATIDLKIDGPVVVEIPKGMYGTANGPDFKYITDMGTTGPDKGKGGKYLFLPPDYKGKVPDGYFVMHSSGYRIWAMMRGFDVGNGDKAVKWFEERLKVYPLAKGPQKAKFVNASRMGANTLVPEDKSAFAMLNEIIQYEPSSLFSMEQLAK